jgi:lipoprotein-anchoring transpeptidase ErfK/SrfK
MNPNHTEAYQYLAQAQYARKSGDKRLARQYAEQAARLAPELEDVWLMLGALASPRASVVFMEKALQINPNSERVRQGLHWAVQRLQNEPPPQPVVATPQPVMDEPAAVVTQPTRSLRTPVLVGLLILMCLAVFAVTAWATPAIVRAASSILEVTHTPAWGVANIAKPDADQAAASATVVPTLTALATATNEPLAAATATEDEEADASTAVDTPEPTETDLPKATSTPRPTSIPTASATAGPSATALPTDDPDFPTPTALPTDTAMPLVTQAVIPTPGANNSGNTGRWIDVDLTRQMVYAYEGSTLVNSFVTSTGTWQYPTVTGQYRVYIKYRYKHMSGPGYSLPDVPFTMFFYQGYAIHGTYWHNNFGTPMSHGCVNLSIPDAEWIYNWSSVGTLVNVHY